ncbi:MAG: hypothetical protein ACR2GC_04150 [Methyloceanibacter sp.]|uniref:hypothetical protein n=1 Tax=Methyloceanibacter sp. TaxID=1965321 RepID=UPI003D9B8076
MVKTCLIVAMAGATLLSLTASAQTMHGEFGNECVTSLALGRTYQTDCSVNTVYKGKTLCFGSEKSRELFLKNPDELLLKAHVFYSSKQQ